MRTLSSRSLHLLKVRTEDLDRVNDLRESVGTKPLTSADLTDRQITMWLIVDRKTNQDLGSISLVPFGQAGAKEIGFAVRPEARGKGVLSAVLPSFVKYLGLELYSETDVKNRACVRVLEKCGFRTCEPAHGLHTASTGETVTSAGFRFEPAAKSITAA